MVEAVKAGTPVRAVARQFGVSRPTVARWVARAANRRLDRVDWADRASIPQRIHRTAPEIEAQVLALRRDLRETSALGEYGAHAIHREWPVGSWGLPPAVRTIGRILARCGALDGRARRRHPAPPRGWYLPTVARGTADCDCCDVIEGLVLQGGPEVEVLTALALHAGLPDAWPGGGVTSAGVLRALQARWRALGLPAFVQFDNATSFQGPHQYPDVVGPVARLCLQLGCVPVFTPLQDPSFQAALESFNGRWQAKVWHRFHHASLHALQGRSAAYIAAARQRGAARAADAPPRRPFPADWAFDPSLPPAGDSCTSAGRRRTGRWLCSATRSPSTGTGCTASSGRRSRSRGVRFASSACDGATLRTNRSSVKLTTNYPSADGRSRHGTEVMAPRHVPSPQLALRLWHLAN